MQISHPLMNNNGEHVRFHEYQIEAGVIPVSLTYIEQKHCLQVLYLSNDHQ